jgi:hypothetical protein
LEKTVPLFFARAYRALSALLIAAPEEKRDPKELTPRRPEVLNPDELRLPQEKLREKDPRLAGMLK